MARTPSLSHATLLPLLFLVTFGDLLAPSQFGHGTQPLEGRRLGLQLPPQDRPPGEVPEGAGQESPTNLGSGHLGRPPDPPERLRFVHIEGRPSYPAFLESLGQGLLVHQPAAGRVHQEGTLPHLRGKAERSAGGGRTGTCHGLQGPGAESRAQLEAGDQFLLILRRT